MFFEATWDRSAAASSRGFPLPGADVLLWTTPDGHRHCLVPAQGVAPRDERFASVLRLRVREVKLDGRPSMLYCDLECTDKDRFGTFDYFIHDLVGQGPPAITRLEAKLNEYRGFWRKPAVGFGPAAAVGLFGELWFLSQWLRGRTADGFRAWTGPLGGLHDFAWTRANVEVKTSPGLPARHQIAGLEQLVPGDGKELLLFSLAVRRDPGVGTRLVDLVAAVADELRSAGLAADFNDRVATLGFRPDAEENAGYRYVVLNGGERLYRVAEGFPRIALDTFRAGELPTGITAVSYEIDLAGCDGLVVCQRGPLDAETLLGEPDTR